MTDAEEIRYNARARYAAQRARETPEERDTRLHREQLQRRRRTVARNARETLDDRTTRRNRETEQRQQRSHHPVSTTVDESELPLARRVIHGAGGGLRHQLARMNIRCTTCGALHWLEERIKSNGSSSTHPIFATCCDKGKVDLPPLTAPPEPLQTLLTENSRRAKKFCDNIRAYNSALSFTSLGATIDERFTAGGIYSFRLQGALYHRIGSLLPTTGESPKFSQLYICDSSVALDGRVGRFPTLDPAIMQDLQNMLLLLNPYAQIYQTVGQWMNNTPVKEIEMRLLCLRSQDRRRYNTPTADEVGAIMVGDGHDGSISDRDIVVKYHDEGLQRVSSLHSAYMPLRYVLLFLRGRQGWTTTMPLRGFVYDNDNNNGGFRRAPYNPEAVGGRNGTGRITQMQYFSHMLHQRAQPAEHVFLSGRLLQEYIVDAWACTEQNRLNYYIEHQSDLRAELYQGVVDAITTGDHDASQIGQRIILPDEPVILRLNDHCT